MDPLKTVQATPTLEPGEARPMRELVEYAGGGIVSKVLKKSPAGSLTLFAFDAGEDLSEHTAPFDAFVLVLEGRAELTIGGVRVRAAPGEIVLMPAGVAHAVRAPERFKMLLMMIREAPPA